MKWIRLTLATGVVVLASALTVTGSPQAHPFTEAQRKALLSAATSVTADRLPVLQRDAENGSVEAQLILGIVYMDGTVIDRDMAGAFALFQRAAKQGHPMAQKALAGFYANGEMVSRDEAKAIEYLRMAADQDYASAQNALGVAYHEGTGVPKDLAAAATWYRKAAEQGNVDAQKNLAGAYDHGVGVKVDHTEAARWLRAAAEQGDPDAQFNLGMAYCIGEGVRKNGDDCEAWFAKASAQGYAAASFYLAAHNAEHPGFAAGPFAQMVADKYFAKSAEQGYALGALMMSRRLRDREQACSWAVIASALGERDQWRKRWAVERPWDDQQFRRELPRRLSDVRKRLSADQIAACERKAQAFIAALPEK